MERGRRDVTKAPAAVVACAPECGHEVHPSSGIDLYLAALPDDARSMIEALRAIVRKGVPDAEESIKWNAPSFAIDGEDRITLGLDIRGGARLVMHRGAKIRESIDLTGVDQAKVAQWPSADRGVAVFRNLEEIRSRESELTALCSRWVAASA
nr:DUF1801 domain-containing protein [uncultured Brevundimonas sp.]